MKIEDQADFYVKMKLFKKYSILKLVIKKKELLKKKEQDVMKLQLIMNQKKN